MRSQAVESSWQIISSLFFTACLYFWVIVPLVGAVVTLRDGQHLGKDVIVSLWSFRPLEGFYLEPDKRPSDFRESLRYYADPAAEFLAFSLTLVTVLCLDRRFKSPAKIVVYVAVVLGLAVLTAVFRGCECMEGVIFPLLAGLSGVGVAKSLSGTNSRWRIKTSASRVVRAVRAFLFAGMAAGAGGIVAWQGAASHYRHIVEQSDNSASIGNMLLEVDTLERIRRGNLSNAVERLEYQLDGTLVSLTPFLEKKPESAIALTDFKEVQKAKDYRTRFPRKTGKQIDEDVAKALALPSAQSNH